MYVDYTRECLEKIDFLPQNTLAYCETAKHKECPFYRTLNDIGLHCDYVGACAAYKHFGIHDFEQFVKITREYCLSENNVKCERFKLRKAGKAVPEELLPDGNTIEKRRKQKP